MHVRLYCNSVWSAGAHGPTKELLDRLRPMLMKYNVSAYFCGHDHEMEHIHEPDSTVEYFLSGAGHETSSSDDNKVNCNLKVVICFNL